MVDSHPAWGDVGKDVVGASLEGRLIDDAPSLFHHVWWLSVGGSVLLGIEVIEVVMALFVYVHESDVLASDEDGVWLAGGVKELSLHLSALFDIT